MKYVILRDDDTCAFTPHACLERLYRPFLGRGMTVNLAVIPEVRAGVRTGDGRPEEFLMGAPGPADRLAPIGEGRALVDYLRSEPGYQVVQHGCHHDFLEFGGCERAELARRLDRGAHVLREAGFARPAAFVAPHDRLSRAAFLEAAKRFGVISTGWFEAGKVPVRWWGAYALKKFGMRRHWRAGGTVLLSHPGCLLSCHRRYSDIPASIRRAVRDGTLTVLVTHWWEYFRGGRPDDQLIAALHEAADWLAGRSDIRVVSFLDVAAGEVPIG